MPISTEATPVIYDCNGATVIFPITFDYLDPTYVLVKHYDDTDGVTSTLTYTTDYTIANDEVQTVLTYPTNDQITISLNVPFTQEVDLEEQGVISADTLDEVHDKLTLMAQQTSIDSGQSIILGVPESPAPDLNLPDVAERGSKYLAFTATGDLSMVDIQSSGTVSTTTYTDEFLLESDATGARDHLGVPSTTEVYTRTALDGGQLDNRYYTETELDAGQLDNRYYTETEVDANTYSRTQLDAGQLDNRYYTETEIDATVSVLENTQPILGRIVVSTWYDRTSGVPSPAGRDWEGVCWSPDLGLFAAVHDDGGTQGVITSPDGITWTNQTTPDTNTTWQSVCWSPSLTLFVAVSFFNAVTATNIIMTSPDGITWTIRSSPTGAVYYDVCWSPDLAMFVAVGDETISTSTNGTSWTERTAPTTQEWRGICWSPELTLFCAVSNGGVAADQVMTSPNGIDWTQRTAIADRAWRDVAWSPKLGLFAAVAGIDSTDVLMTSPNGINWTSRTPPAAPRNWEGIVWSPDLGQFCAVAASTSNNINMTSEDGITWYSRSVPAASNEPWYNICWSSERGVFCAVGGSSTYTNEVMTTVV